MLPHLRAEPDPISESIERWCRRVQRAVGNNIPLCGGFHVQGTTCVEDPRRAMHQSAGLLDILCRPEHHHRPGLDRLAGANHPETPSQRGKENCHTVMLCGSSLVGSLPQRRLLTPGTASMPHEACADVLLCRSVIAATIVQLYYLPRFSSADPTYNLWIPVLCAQVVVSFSIISACVPFLKFLIDALETGLVRADGRRAGATNKFSSSGDGAYHKAKGSNFKSPPFSSDSSKPPRINQTSVLRMNSLNGVQNVVTNGSRSDDDLDSQSSQTHIMRRVEWTLTEETAGPPRV